MARLEEEAKQRAAATQKAQELLRDRLYECTTKQLIRLVGSSEPAEVLASAALTICDQEADQAIRAGIALMRAEDPNVTDDTLQQVEREMRATVRREVVTNAVQVRAARAAANASDQKPPENAALHPPSASPQVPMQTPDECIKTASTLREGRLVDQEKLVSLMLDLCRPEIENAARSAFLSDPATSLDEARRSAAAEALASARRFVGVP
ncbi:hypothetical protein KBI52_03355 [Microvirga sp. HBU67558]|uniref:hypothetical protein n=1 Tax=Microvirga TaxID=186650 RepID=UPI001B390244|nr:MULTISPECIES: hypothetical protein [unclassified Microvirga]MBQ0819270.1 hypothetical protein [Microvirga sp. HBU67558]